MSTINGILNILMSGTFLWIFAVALFIVYFEYKRNLQMEEEFLGTKRRDLMETMMDVTWYGIVCGFFGSLVIVGLGISFQEDAILPLWFTAIFLMFFNIRYLCFSYAGGLLALSSLLLGFPEVYVPSLIALIGLLHLMESALIWYDGYRNCIPVTIEQYRYSAAGAHYIRKFWPVPFFTLIIGNFSSMGVGIEPFFSWWPLLGPAGNGGHASFMLFPLAAVLGYSDIAITQSPREKARRSAHWLALYSITLLIMAVLSTRMKVFQYIASVSAPVLHEILLLRGRRSQEEGQVRLNAPRRGIRVLDIRPETPGEAMGLQVGDIILRVNGRDVNSETMLNSILEKYPPYITVDIIDEKKNEKSLEYRDFQKGIGDLGVIFVPRQTGHFYYIEDPPGLLWWLIKKFVKIRKTEADNH